MTVKALALAFAGVPFFAPAQLQTHPVVNIAGVEQVVCDEGRGTAFRTAPRQVTSARHVTSMTDCTSDGVPMEHKLFSGEDDWSISDVAVTGKALQIDCEGFKEGEPYFGVGFARGLPYQQVVKVYYLERYKDLAPWDDYAALAGDRFIPGQSGGPVFNKEGKVVGIVKGYNAFVPMSYARAVKDTPLCA